MEVILLELILLIDILSTSCEIGFKWVPAIENPIDDKAVLATWANVDPDLCG